MIDFRKVIELFDSGPPENVQMLARQFFKGNGPKFLLGRNSESAILNDLFNIDGFIDDFSPPGTSWHGKRVLRGTELPIDSVVVNCVSNSKPRTAHARLVANGTNSVLGYADLCRSGLGQIPLLPFVEHTRRDVKQNRSHWVDLYASLSDSASRQVFDDILRYRLTGDYRVLADYDYRPADQYFENFIGERFDVFVDAGGYDGDTTERFCKRYPYYRRVYLFEPDEANLAKAKQRLKNTRDIQFVGQGVSDCSGSLNFAADRGSASAVTTEAGVAIPVTTIDTHINEPVSLIKMDLEGWELNSLKGSQRHLLEDRPVLAIGAYHHPTDFWRISEFVQSLNLGYNLYMRHYSESWTETVLYFVPADSADTTQ